MSFEVADCAVADLKGQPALQVERSLSDASGCANTAMAHLHAAERAIVFMSEHFSEPISLQDMAEVAQFSPYHFNRVFRSITGISPGRFLTALRMEIAKRLILSTPSSITDVCFDVGYNSLGTFTSHFTQVVGLSPRGLRYFAQDFSVPDLAALPHHANEGSSVTSCNQYVTGRIIAPDVSAAMICVGLFATPVPQGRPVSCVLLTAPGVYRIAAVPDGHYYLFAAAFAFSDDPRGYLLPNAKMLRIGAGHDPVFVWRSQMVVHADVTLRPVQLTDPPIVVALPFLLMEHLGVRGCARPRNAANSADA